jgi:chromosome segregation ATPase
MKLILPIALGIVSIVLAISLYLTKQDDNAQHESDTGSITDFSNQLVAAQSQITERGETILTLSNSVSEFQSASSTFSNQLMDAKSAAAQEQEQITSLNGKITEIQAGNLALDRHAAELTNQLAGLARELATTKSGLAETNLALAQANKDYLLLENRFRIDVGERTLVQRKFNNIAELKAQIQALKEVPFAEIYPELIYAGLGVEVKSNGTFHVIDQN